MRSRLALKLTYPKPKSAPNLLPSFTLWRIHICICGSICICICGSICILICGSICICISPYHDMTLWDCCNISNISQVSSAAVVLIVCVSRSCKAGSHVPFILKIVQQVSADGFGAKKLIPFLFGGQFILSSEMDLHAAENGFVCQRKWICTLAAQKRPADCYFRSPPFLTPPQRSEGEKCKQRARSPMPFRSF